MCVGWVSGGWVGSQIVAFITDKWPMDGEGGRAD